MAGLIMAEDIQAELEALRKAYATGATRVRFRDREIYFASGADLQERIKHLERRLRAPRIAGVAGFSRGRC